MTILRKPGGEVRLRGMMKQHEVEVDFLVAGGGLSGVCAAIAAARNGATVGLVQDRSVLGGNASSEVKMHVVGADCHGAKPGLRESGLIEELRLEDAVRNPHRCYSQWDLLLYEKVKAEPGISLWLDTDVVGVIKEGDRIVAARAVRLSTEDEFVIRAKFFADCTGDGRLGAEAGADFQQGREGRDVYGESLAQEVGDRQTLGSSILLTGRKYDAVQVYRAPAWTRKFQRSDFRLRPIRSFEYGYWWFEWGGQLDTIKDNESIRHELLRIALGVWDYVKNSGEYPEAANWALDWVGAMPGKRESRRFLGSQVLTQQAVQEGEVGEDVVAYGGWWIDTHPPMGVDAPDEPPCVQHKLKHIYGIPLGCLHSRNVGNLFFAGRNISASHIAFASTRVMATCAVMGQAIGTAAAVWRGEGGSDIRELATREKVGRVQQALLRDDAFLPGVAGEDAGDLARGAVVTASSERSPVGRVVDGVTRDLKATFGPWSADTGHGWESKGLPATLVLGWAKPVVMREIHLTFDSGFERGELILSMSDHHTRTSAPRAAQGETVKDYRVLVDGVAVVEEAGNYLRKRVHRLAVPVEGTRVELEVTATNGAEVARVFEVRVYG